MLRIGIIGANGQVGSEVSLILARRADVQVAPICRSGLGASFLERCGLECRIGRADSPQQAREILGGLDLVADFSLPGGSQAEIRSQISRIVTEAIAAAPAEVPFVYASSMMAFGVARADERFRWRLIARTPYGASKRYGERVARRAGQRHGRPVYILRIGQVHGVLQSVSRAFFAAVREHETIHVPAAPAFAVFTVSIADALVNIARGNERPGTFTLIEDPEWSWKEVWELHARLAEANCEIPELPAVRNGALGKGLLSQARGAVMRRVVRVLTRNRDLLSWYVLSRTPEFERRMRAQHALRSARSEIAELASAGNSVLTRATPVRVPGKRILFKTDHARIEAELKEISSMLEQITPSPPQYRMRA